MQSTSEILHRLDTLAHSSVQFDDSQPIYDTDEESYESLVIDEDSLSLHSVTTLIIGHILIGLGTSEQTTSNLREDTSAIYDESSISEYEGDTLERERESSP